MAQSKTAASKKPSVDSKSASSESAGKPISWKVHNMAGKEVGSMELSSSAFGITPNQALVHDTVRWQLARRRAGTHSALTRTMMEGGAKKPFKQKGTGRARQGSSIGPHMVGGAVVHGPLPRDYDYRLPKRTRRQALASVLSDKVLSQKLVIVDSLEIPSGKTKEMAAVLKNIGVSPKSAVVVVPSGAPSELVTRSLRNISKVCGLDVIGANVYDILKHEYLVCTKEAVKGLEERIAKL